MDFCSSLSWRNSISHRSEEMLSVCIDNVYMCVCAVYIYNCIIIYNCYNKRIIKYNRYISFKEVEPSTHRRKNPNRKGRSEKTCFDI